MGNCFTKSGGNVAAADSAEASDGSGPADQKKVTPSSDQEGETETQAPTEKGGTTEGGKTSSPTEATEKDVHTPAATQPGAVAGSGSSSNADGSEQVASQLSAEALAALEKPKKQSDQDGAAALGASAGLAGGAGEDESKLPSKSKFSEKSNDLVSGATSMAQSMPVSSSANSLGVPSSKEGTASAGDGKSSTRKRSGSMALPTDESRKQVAKMNEDWEKENNAIDMPPWLSQQLSIREAAQNDDSSGFGSISSDD